MRAFTLHCLKFNIVFKACHVPGINNELVQGVGPGRSGSSRDIARRGMEHWRSEANRAISLAIAPSTRCNYAAACEDFLSFCRGEDLVRPWLITVDHLQQYGVYLHRKGLAPHTIQGRMSALTFYVKAQGFPDPASDFRVRIMTEGWSKERGSQEDRWTTMPRKILFQLGQVWEDICNDHYEVKLFKAAMLCALFRVFRI